ncbi:MAG: methylated-DNA--[protein]-cysteine S-methyltransferase [Bacteriovoracaceae bacterium]|nr:methylated-DNA--[protein]-cysteine S-methyltransferase [Bacteriovoracaceae bacterium]
MAHSIFSSKIGGIKVTSQESSLIKIEFLGEVYKVIENSNPLNAEAKKQILAFLSGDLIKFDLPYKLVGTDFQKETWSFLALIPFGHLKSYQDVAMAINRPRAIRAVGGAANRNPLPLVIPCHRVIGKSGALVGFAPGLSMKKQLLRLEGHQVIEDSIG